MTKQNGEETGDREQQGEETGDRKQKSEETGGRDQKGEERGDIEPLLEGQSRRVTETEGRTDG